MRNASLGVLFLVCLVTSLMLNASFLAAQTPANSWETKAPMPTPRSGFGLVTVNGSLYAIGGFNKGEGDFSSANEMYDPATNTWEQKAPMPTHRVSFALVAFQDKIYVFGGQILVNGHRVVINVSEVYDPASDSWATLTAMPHLGEDFAAYDVVGNTIYLVGNFTDVYDPATDSWVTKATIPTLTAHSANAEVDGKIYVMSGNHWGNDPNFYAPIDLTQIYDSSTDTWSDGPPIPVGVASAAAVATSGVDAPKAVYVVGGLTLTSDSNGSYTYHPQKFVQVYYPENDSWVMGADMPTARYALATGILSDKVYAMGGSDARETPDLASNELYLPFGYGTLTGQVVPQAVILGIAVAAVAVAVIVAFLLIKRRTKSSLAH